ncbi:MAG: hypothetical protein OXI11_07645 [Gammaproteobacteria bacterium]|nr:hypothetical protein [Gammaproteobacteria bacterium]MXW45120.1 hypothetical protein [Gammaproteobacteria bacterium]MYD01906.1 hypothetical protein [Gammaproteobacteria bacterium]MYI26115.1 hypothetical protein [Gammaproteobacteria bacterium]
MFDELKRELRRLEGVHEIPVSILTDDEGFFDRQCPSSDCLFQFKIHEKDWHDKVRDEEVFCPFCGHTAESDNWCTEEQHEHNKRTVMAHISQRLHPAMKRDASRWNRRQPRDSFITMTMKVDGRPQSLPLPLAATEPMQLKITCPACACRYAVLGAAFFCPACGHSAADMMFDQTVAGIRDSLNALGAVRTAVADPDTAETAVRQIIEYGLLSVVTAFQRYAEVLYFRMPATQQAHRNAFQNLTAGSDLWHVATGKHYSDYLGAVELAELKRAFQQRHLLAHTQGIVDKDYVTRSGDTSYQPGQRLVVRKDTVLHYVDLIEKLATGMAADAK